MYTGFSSISIIQWLKDVFQQWTHFGGPKLKTQWSVTEEVLKGWADLFQCHNVLN